MEHSIPVFPGISNHALYCCTVRFSNHIRHYQAMDIKLCPQVSISPLPFILILIGLALTVIAGISWRVWKAANENLQK